jgi:hypothetical protein
MPESSHKTAFAGLGLIAALLATVLLRNTGGTSDVEIWLRWADVVHAEGLQKGYRLLNADYPPGSSAVLHAVVTTAIALDLTPSESLKLWLTAALTGVALLVFLTTRNLGLAVAVYAVCLLNAVGLLYLDVLTAPFLVIGFAAGRRGNWPQLLFWWSCSAVMKYQPVLLLPFALLFSVKRQTTSLLPTVKWLPWVTGIAAVWGGLALFFGLDTLVDSFTRASRHNTLSSFSANPLWILTWVFQAANGRATAVVDVVPASRPMLRVLLVLSLVLYGYVLHRYWRAADDSFSSLCRFSVCGFLVYVLVSAGVHENHLFIPALVAILFAGESRRWWPTAVALAVGANLNLLAFYGWTGYVERRVIGIDLTVWAAIVVSILLVLTCRRLLADQA